MLLNSDEWSLKVAALLHDPIFKPLHLTEHEMLAAELAKALGVADMKVYDTTVGYLVKEHKSKDPRGVLKRLVESDWSSSAVERMIAPEHVYVNEILPIQPMSGRQMTHRRFKIPYPLNAIYELMELIAEHVNGIKDIGRLDSKSAFIALWLLLPDALHKALKASGSLAEVAPLSFLLPADTRVPNHSVFDHIITVSALVPCVQEDGSLRAALLSVDLGGVQNYLSFARTTADLWAGSWITSSLTWAGIRVVSEEVGPDAVIYPDIRETPFGRIWAQLLLGIKLKDAELMELTEPVIPNSFLAIIPAKTADELADCVKNTIIDAWKTLFSIARDYIEEEFKRTDFQDAWERQSENLPLNIRVETVKWPSTPPELEAWFSKISGELHPKVSKVIDKLIKQGKGKRVTIAYSGLWDEASIRLGAYKWFRPFYWNVEPAKEAWGQVKARCDLCGYRNPLWAPEDIVWEELRRRGLVDFDENLCAVCLTKRLFRKVFQPYVKQLLVSKDQGAPSLKLEEPRYPSTADLAVAEFRRSVLKLWELLIQQHLDEKRTKLIATLSNFLEAWRDFHRTIGEETQPVQPSLPKLKAELFDFMKRVGGEESRLLATLLSMEGGYLYPETYSRMAERVKRREGQAWKAYQKANLDKATKRAEEALEKFLKAYREALKAIDERRLPKPFVVTPNDTFTLIGLDGDSMGEWVSGRRNPTFRKSIHPKTEKVSKDDDLLETIRPKSPASHSTLSRTMAFHGLKVVKRVVEKDFCGRVVYSGGDDIVALLPPEHAFPATIRLREEHSREWSLEEGAIVYGLGCKASSSGGIACAHYMYPLSDLVKKTRDLEKNAKKFERGAKEFKEERTSKKKRQRWEKDSAAGRVFSRAGVLASFGPFHWIYPQPQEPNFVGDWTGVSSCRRGDPILSPLSKGAVSPLILAHHMALLIRGAKRDFKLSKRFIYDLLSATQQIQSLPEPAVRVEMSRLLKRHIVGDPDYADQLLDRLVEIHHLIGIKRFAQAVEAVDKLMGQVIYK